MSYDPYAVGVNCPTCRHPMFFWMLWWRITGHSALVCGRCGMVLREPE